MELTRAATFWNDYALIFGTVLIALASIIIWTILQVERSSNQSRIATDHPFRPSTRSETKENTHRTTTYRLKGLPQHLDRQGVESVVRRTLELPSDVEVEVRSLARSPYLRNENIATLNFLNTPGHLSGGKTKDEWSFKFPGDDRQDDTDAYLVFDTHFRGFTPLHFDDDANSRLDLIAITGLGGHAFGSFKEKSGSHMWLRDSLPKDLPGTRILIYGYDTSLADSNSFQNTHDLGRQFRTSISDIRNHLLDLKYPRPLLLLGHSLGGIVIKQAVIEMHYDDELHQAHLKSVYGMLFFGVPSQGMSIKSLIPMVGNQPNRFLLESLGKTSAVLQDQIRIFPEKFYFRDSPIISFYETKQSPTARENARGEWEMSGPPTILVDQYSATHHRPWESSGQFTHPTNRNHSELVKFSKQDTEYETVLNYLLKFRENADAVIKMRFCETDINVLPNLSEQTACLHSLTFKEEDLRRHNTLTVVNTCTWLLEHPKYKSWLQLRQGLLWVKGKPGAGKSTLMKFAIRDRELQAPQNGTVVASFFLNGRGADIEKTPIGLVRSLLRQILTHFPDQLAKLTSTFRERRKTKGEIEKAWSWSVGELQDFLNTVLPEIPAHRPILIYVDALDESGEQNAIELVDYFTKLMSTVKDAPTSLKICFSCRPYPLITWNHGSQICVEDENQKDIRAYVREKLEGNFDSEEMQSLGKQVVDRAGGVFQWVVLVIPRLREMQRKGESFHNIQASIQTIPNDLNILYKDLLQSFNDEDRTKSIRLLGWICFATRPLTPRELQHAMAIDPNTNYDSVSVYQKSGDFVETEEKMERKITDLSKGLAEVKGVGENRVAQLIHQSVGDYLLESGFEMLEGLSQGSASGQGHFRLSRSCIRYLCMKDRHVWTLALDENVWAQYPLLEYAANAWTTHTAIAEQNGISQVESLQLFDWPSTDILQSWIQVRRHIDRYQYDLNFSVRGMTLLHVASHYGFYSVVNAIATRPGVEADSIDSEGRTALSWAAGSGHKNIVEFLLQTGRVEPDRPDIHGRTPLSWAVEDNNYGTVRALLACEEVDPNAIGEDQKTPLLRAAKNADREIMELFITRKGSQVQITEAVVLAAASNRWNGKEVMMLLLEQRGAEGQITEVAVAEIARSFDNEVMMMLMEQRVKIPISDHLSTSRRHG